MPVFAFNVTLLPEQNVVLPPAVMVAVGAALTVTVVAELVLLHDPLVTTTV